MSYEPTNWKNGDIITAEKMNKLENAVAQGVSPLIVQQVFEQNQVRLDKTFGEIRSAFLEGRPVILTERGHQPVFTDTTGEDKYEIYELLIDRIFYEPLEPAGFQITIQGMNNYILRGESDNLNDYKDQYLSIVNASPSPDSGK